MEITSFSGEYRFLSNFWPSWVALDGCVFPTVEHAYQAAKTLDVSERATIMRMVSPSSAKRIGRTLTIRTDWDDVKIPVMRSLLCRKFEDIDLLHKLRSTRPCVLIEGNTWGDRFWGVSDGDGENHLGRLLMEIRDGRPYNAPKAPIEPHASHLVLR